MRGWFDISSLDFDQRQQDNAGILASTESVRDLIQNEIDRGVLANNIILAGFSQGGAVALYTALTHNQQLGGILALSTYLPLQQSLLAEHTIKQLTMPIMMAHGNYDNVIPLSVGTQSRDFMQQLGIDIEWFAYDIAHSVSQEEIHQISHWFRHRFGM